MVYDCFQFFNELDLLKLRLQILSPVVDKFVISEATETFSGLPKPLYYEENKEMFAEFQDRIIHVVVSDTPPGPTHERDTYQKNGGTKGIAECKDDDIILFSDLDEIPDPKAILSVLENFQDDKIYHFAQRLFYCYLNMEEVSGNLLSYAGEFEGVEQKQWIGTKMCSYRLMKEKNIRFGELRYPQWKEIGIRVADGGWHFGYMGGSHETDIKKRVRDKVVSAAHQEYNSRSVLSEVEDKIKDGEDIFGREAKFVKVEIDETFPAYLREHQEEYAHLILKDETESEKKYRHLRAQIRKLVFKCGRGVKKIFRK